MSSVSEERRRLQLRRKRRIRAKISGTADRPRMSVFRSSRHVYVQVIDDLAGATLVSASTFEKGAHRQANRNTCLDVGKVVAQRCQAKGIKAVVFDKNGNQYHGRVEAVATGAREGGLSF